MKFLGGADNEQGILKRRRVKAWVVIPIGKEADNLEARGVLGEVSDTVEWSIAGYDRMKVLHDIEDVLTMSKISDAELLRRAGVSHHTLADLRNGKRLAAHSFLSLAKAAEGLRREAKAWGQSHAKIIVCGQHLASEMGSVAKLAGKIGVSRQYMGRVLNSQKAMTEKLAQQILQLCRELNGEHRNGCRNLLE